MIEDKSKKIMETKWQEFWAASAEAMAAKDDSDKPKKYILVEFPYPSGSGLHIGHAFSFTGGDIYARFKRMQGFNVMFPMGWDAFGLPTENYAIKMKKKPQEVTKENTDMFRNQMKKLAFSFDWSREVNTTDPSYYKWTQWIFIKLFEKGLAYKKEMPINWCPSCKIGLANEEVVDGKCERCGTGVSRRNISQWVVKITDYADKLIDGLKSTDFIEKVKQAQINWIGKSEGAKIRFSIVDDRPACRQGKSSIKNLEVFTTRPDTLFGATFMVVAPEHDLVKSSSGLSSLSSEKKKEIEDYVKDARKKSDLERTELNKEKTGVFSGLYAINPVNGKEIPIWISDFVLASYGTGAIMAVPAHDERDFAFAKKFKLPIVPVIKQDRGVARSYLMGASKIIDEDLTKIGIKIVEKLESGDKKIEIPKNKIEEYEKLIIDKLDLGFWNEYLDNATVFIFKFKDGTVKRVELNQETEEEIDRLAAEFNDKEWTKKQSVWAWLADNDWYEDYIFTADVNNGEIINSPPINGLVPAEAFEKMIKWLEEKKIGEKTVSYHLRDWIFSRQHYWGEPIPMIFCEEHGWQSVLESDLPVKLPEVDQYEPTETGESPLSKMTEWVKTKCPVCGGEAKRETDTMPNWAGSDWYFLRYIDPHNDTVLASNELMKKWLPVDVYIGGDEHNTLHLLYSRFIYKFLWDIGVVPVECPEPYYKRMSHGVILGPDNQRMSKSRGNVIVPEDVSSKYGIDVVRMYLMFMGPFDGTMAWNENTLMGVKRFLDRFEKYIISQKDNKIASNKEVKVIINKLIVGVTKDMEEFGYNTVIAKMMEALNKISDLRCQISDEDIKTLIKLIAPLAPYMAEELWFKIKEESDSLSVHISEWPKADPQYLVEDKIKIAVSVNGRVRDVMEISNDKLLISNEIIQKAKGLEKIKKWIGNQQIIKEIYVPGRMVNLVIK